MEKSAQDRIEAVLEHIQNVQRNCYKLGLKLIKSGDVEFGRILIANGQIHDNSKLTGIEFEHLFGGDPLLMTVVKHHSSTNPHHPEYWVVFNKCQMFISLKWFVIALPEVLSLVVIYVNGFLKKRPKSIILLWMIRMVLE